MTDPTMVPRGHSYSLRDGRMVFIGTDPEHPDKVFFCFRDNAWVDTKVILSRPAFELLLAGANSLDLDTSGEVCPPNPRDDGRPVTFWETATDVVAERRHGR